MRKISLIAFTILACVTAFYFYSLHFELPLASKSLEPAQPAPLSTSNPLTWLDLAPDGGHPRDGFFLSFFNGKRVEEIPLHIDQSNDRLVATTPRFPEVSFEFALRETDRYLALALIKASGLDTSRDCGLLLRASRKRTGRVQVIPLDYMIKADAKSDTLAVHWPYLWNRHPDDPLGSFALYRLGDDASNDASLTSIWVNEDFPRPATGEPWTEAAVGKWIGRYHQEFAGLSETTLAASNADDLYFLSDKMKGFGVRRIYLHTDTWRGEYWPRKQSFVDVNQEVFPNGREDLARYSQYLSKNGMLLRLHSVSAGIGYCDAKLVKTTSVNGDIARWAHGTLAQPLSASDQEIHFRPAPGTSFPHLRMPAHWNFQYFCIGNEIVRAKVIQEADQPVWRLSDLQRNVNDNPLAPGSHPAGTPVTALYSSYGQNFVPAPDSPLFEKMAVQYADLINRMHLSHQHFDGAEIHHAIAPWGFDKLSAIVARHLKHPVTSSTSGGRTAPWNIEMRFSKIRALKELGYWPATVPVLLDSHRNASSLLDAHYQIGEHLLLHGRRLGFGKPEPMFGLSRQAEEEHGLMPEFAKLIEAWKGAIYNLSPAAIDYLHKHLSPIERPLRQRGNHYESLDVPVMEKRADGFYFIPTRVLGRAGIDSPWIVGQEFGALGPRQYLQAQTATASEADAPPQLVVENPHAAQPPGVILHVLPALGQGSQSEDVAQPSPPALHPKSHNRQDQQLDDYSTGTHRNGLAGDLAADAPLSTELWPKAGSRVEIEQKGATRLAFEGEAILLNAKNPHSAPLWDVAELPSWRCKIPLNGRRGLAIDVEGDNSGACLVVQLHGRGVRDYVVKLDFKGRRRIIIPNGEVAWSNAAWGWRFDSKFFVYDGALSKISLGFGYLPAHSKARAVVHGLTLLDNIAAPLVNPTLTVGNATLHIEGAVESGHYLTYEAEAGARVYDANWNFLRTLPARAEKWEVGPGKLPVRLTATGVARHQAHQRLSPGQKPWLELQLLTRGPAYRFQTLEGSTQAESSE